MLSGMHYAQNHASIIGWSLILIFPCSTSDSFIDSFTMVIGSRLAKCTLLSLLEVTFQLTIQIKLYPIIFKVAKTTVFHYEKDQLFMLTLLTCMKYLLYIIIVMT